MRRIWSVTLALFLVAANVSAQTQAPAADALFDKGVAEMEAGRFAAACPAIADSFKLDPRPGTLFTLAECEVGLQKVSLASKHYTQYVNQIAGLPAAQQGKHAERKQRALDTLKRLEASMPHVTLTPAAGAPADLSVLLDAEPVAASSFAKPLGIDAGDHEVVVRHAGRERSQKFVVAAGEQKAITLEPPPSEAPPPPPPPVPEATPGRASPPYRTIMYVGAGVGAAGLIAGTIGGVLAFSKKSDADQQCVELRCSAAGQRSVESGRNAALVGTIGFGVGLAGAGVAVAMFLLDRSEPPTTSRALRLAPTIGRGAGAIALAGGW